MANEIKHADVLSEELLLTVDDGSVAIVKHQDVIECAQKTAGFERAEEVRRQADKEDQSTDELSYNHDGTLKTEPNCSCC
ncbi:hypothetical protein [Terriglobus roseus]|uniref:hypothetical protein n=1 Tax=Terriglobus roseus TaxID=392734 RepID=UPI0005A2589F|nr:hypothetical protein [Terriglobus roseus]